MNKLTFPNEFGPVTGFYSINNKVPKGARAVREGVVHLFYGPGQRAEIERLVIYRDKHDRYFARPDRVGRPGFVYETDGPDGVFILCETPLGCEARPWAEYREGGTYMPDRPAIGLPGISYLIRVPAGASARWSVHSPAGLATNICLSPSGPEFVHLLPKGPLYQWYIGSHIEPNAPALEGLCRAVHALHCRWWPTGGGRSVPEAVMLIVTELAEAIEAYRRGNSPEFVEELADTAIRLFDLVGGLGLEWGFTRAVTEKVRRNTERPDHRTDVRSGPGGKRF